MSNANVVEAASDDSTKEPTPPKYTLISNAAKFSPGQIVATPGALALMQRTNTNPLILLNRHLHGDWGDICADDAELNAQALKDGSRILSSYRIVEDSDFQALTPKQPDRADTNIWIITDAAMDFAHRRFVMSRHGSYLRSTEHGDE